MENEASDSKYTDISKLLNKQKHIINSLKDKEASMKHRLVQYGSHGSHLSNSQDHDKQEIKDNQFKGDFHDVDIQKMVKESVD